MQWNISHKKMKSCHLTTWWICITFNEVSHIEKERYSMISLICGI